MLRLQYFLFLLSILLIAGCDSSVEEVKSANIRYCSRIKDVLSDRMEFGLFIGTFPTLVGNPVLIRNTGDTIQYSKEIKSIPFSLRKMNNLVSRYPFKMKSHKSNLYLGVFVHGKVVLNDSLVALIVNREGMYAPSAFDLHIVDVKNQKWLGKYFIADSWGDAGYVMTRLSWLTDVDQDGFTDIITRNYAFSPDNGVGESKTPGVITDSVIVKKFDGQSFVNTIVRVSKQHAADWYPQLLFDGPAEIDTIIYDRHFPMIDFSDFLLRTKKYVYPL